MGQIRTLRCISCGSEYAQNTIDYTCPACGARRGTLEVLYNYDRLRRDLTRESFAQSRSPSMWRYMPLLPIEGKAHIQPLRVGWTPTYRFPGLAAELGLSELILKDDGQNPTASYKDRASAVAVIKAQEKGRSVITCASTGNAASSLAGFAASTSLKTVIFVPETAPEAKVTQRLIYGARVFLVKGSYDQAYDLASEAAESFDWYNRSAAVNPYLVEGKKTGALELAEQLEWSLPDAVFVSVGDGSVISGLCKGFAELQRIGLIAQSPQVVGVQAEGAAPIAAAFAHYEGGDVTIEDIEASTIADSICVGAARDIVKAVTYVHSNGGRIITVSDRAILDAIAFLAGRTGVFAEPAAAAAFAGVQHLAASGDLKRKSAAVVITGSGLKDVGAARRAVDDPIRIEPSLDQVKEHLCKFI